MVMATKTLNVRMQQLRKTNEQWIDTVISNRPLLVGEIGFDYTTDGFKVGNGINLYDALPWYSCVMSGTIISFASGTRHSGYLLCNGAAVSRETYAKLFSVCGTKYGAGNGSTTFNVPDLLERYVKGFGDSTANITGGANTVVLTTNTLPVHDHALYSHTFAWGDGACNVYSNNTQMASGSPPGNNPCTKQGSWNRTDTKGSGQAHNNEPAYTKAYYYIKY